MSVRFNPGGLPFPRWVGPYAPARGKKAGFKVLQGRLGAWVEEGDASAFWTIRTSPGGAKPVAIRWVTVPGGLPAGVDLSDRAAMRD